MHRPVFVWLLLPLVHVARRALPSSASLIAVACSSAVVVYAHCGGCGRSEAMSMYTWSGVRCCCSVDCIAVAVAPMCLAITDLVTASQYIASICTVPSPVYAPRSLHHINGLTTNGLYWPKPSVHMYRTKVHSASMVVLCQASWSTAAGWIPDRLAGRRCHRPSYRAACPSKAAHPASFICTRT
jgi:hypothetical protein